MNLYDRLRIGLHTRTVSGAQITSPFRPDPARDPFESALRSAFAIHQRSSRPDGRAYSELQNQPTPQSVRISTAMANAARDLP